MHALIIITKWPHNTQTFNKDPKRPFKTLHLIFPTSPSVLPRLHWLGRDVWGVNVCFISLRTCQCCQGTRGVMRGGGGRDRMLRKDFSFLDS